MLATLKLISAHQRHHNKNGKMELRVVEDIYNSYHEQLMSSMY